MEFSECRLYLNHAVSENNHIDLVESISDVKKIELQKGRDISFTTQTTLSVDDTHEIVEALKVKFPNIQSPKKSDICYATQNRQDSVKEVIKHSQILIVIGSKNSSNSNRLKEIADNKGKPSYLIDGPEDIDNEWLDGISSIGITAGASAPEILVQEVVSFLMSNGGSEVIELGGAEESVSFPIPALLKE